MEILKLCRSCMKGVASWELENFDASVVSMFTYCTTVEVSEDDKLPKQFCYDCTIKIESSYTFIKKSQEVNITLKNLVSRVETSVIVKSENLNNLIYNECKSLQSDSGLTEAKINKNKFTPNPSQCFENQVEQDIYLSPAIKSIDTVEETLKAELIEVTINDLDEYSDCKSNDDDYYNHHNVEKTTVENIESNDINNESHKTTQNERDEEVSEENLTFGKKSYNTRSKMHKSEFKTQKKGKKKQIEDKNRKDTFFKCEICKLIFIYHSNLQKHVENKHSKDTKEKDGDMPRVQENKSDNTNPHLKTCEFCDRTFTSALWFSRHIQNEHSDCAKQYNCPHCPKSFPSYHAWYYHKDLHTESRPFACDACGARFKRGKQLAAHARTHANARPYICTQCGKAFKIKSILTNHQKLHMDEKAFLCSVCGYSTRLLATLKSHMLTHTGEKPYACPKCPFTSSTPGNVTRHEMRHRGERRYACQHCSKRFYDPGTLTRHVRIHTGERPFQCILCNLTFTDGWKTKTHIMRTHRIPLENIPRLSKMKTAGKEATIQLV